MRSGRIWSFGRNDYGQLGDGTTQNRSSPVSVLCEKSFVSIVTNNFSCAAIDTEGMIWTWGYNGNGQLGDGSIENRSSPVRIARSGSYTKIVAWYVPYKESGSMAAIDDKGMIWTWGKNQNGQLGDGTIQDRSSPVSILRLGSYKDVFFQGYAASSGTNHRYRMLALDHQGMIWGWGSNHSGGLGDNTGTYRSSPVSIVRPGSYSRIFMSSYSSYAIDGATGNVWSWGYNLRGELGLGDTISRSSPTSLLRQGSYLNITCDNNSAASTCLTLDSNGFIWSFGDNQNIGALGDGSIQNRSSPVSVLGGPYKDLYYSTFKSHAVDVSDKIWSWGYNTTGGIGDGTTNHRSSPVSVVTDKRFFKFIPSMNNLVAITTDTRLYVSGSGTYGLLGNGTTQNRSYIGPISSNRFFFDAASQFGIMLLLESQIESRPSKLSSNLIEGMPTAQDSVAGFPLKDTQLASGTVDITNINKIAAIGNTPPESKFGGSQSDPSNEGKNTVSSSFEGWVQSSTEAQQFTYKVR